MKRIIHSQEHLIQVNRRSAQRTIAIASSLIVVIGIGTPALISRAAGGNINLSCGASSATADASGNYVLRQDFTNVGGNVLYPYNNFVNGTYMDAYYIVTPVPAGAYAGEHFFGGIVTNPSTYNILPGQTTYASTAAITGLAAGTTYTLQATFQDGNFIPILNCASSVTRPAPATPVPTAVPATPRLATPRPATPAPSTQRPATPKLVNPPPVAPGPPRPSSFQPSLVADTQPPSAPTDFTAQVSGTHAVIDVAWTASSDNIGVSSYHLERSIDQVSWEVLTLRDTSTSFEDDAVRFGVQYYYRIQAKDAAGNASPTVTASATTASFETTSGDSDVTYESPDKLARVMVPAGAFSEPANCSLDAISGGSGRGTKQHPVVALGPYRLLCKNANAEPLGNSDKPLTWTLMLKGHLKGLTKPAVIAYDESGLASDTKELGVVQKDGSMVFQSTSEFALAAAASSISYAWVGYVIGAIILILCVMAGAWLVIRRNRKVNYNQYLRSKYYNL